MDLIKSYSDDDQDIIQDNQMADETSNPVISSDQPEDNSGCDGLVVKDLVDGLMSAIDQQRTESDESNNKIRDKTSDKTSDKIIDKISEHSNGKEDQVRPKIRRRNDDEIMISSDDESSSDESSSDESSSDESSSDKSNIRAPSADELNSDAEEIDLDKCLTRFAPLKTKGELLIEELPPPEEEHIQLTCNVDQLQQIGSVAKILDNLVIVESFKDLPALDLDSVLFFRTGKSIGRVFDVIGSVSKPFYIIRFVANETIQANSIFVHMPVYFVPPNLCLSSFQELNVTKYVLVSQLKNTKGSDASWLHNNEPPENVKEYSDDEEERRDKEKLKCKRKYHNRQ